MPAYYLAKDARRERFKRYDRRQAKRDIHDAGVVSHKLSAAVRRLRRHAAKGAS